MGWDEADFCMNDPLITVDDLTDQIATAFTKRQIYLGCAESCTGGGIMYQLTSKAGSSAWFDAGFVTYSNQAKIDCLGVVAQCIERYGAVSEQVVEQMALGVISKTKSNIAIATSGIAGPGGGSAEKPVGTVCFGLANECGETRAVRYLFHGDRESVRSKAIYQSLALVLEFIE